MEGSGWRLRKVRSSRSRRQCIRTRLTTVCRRYAPKAAESRRWAKRPAILAKASCAMSSARARLPVKRNASLIAADPWVRYISSRRLLSAAVLSDPSLLAVVARISFRIISCKDAPEGGNAESVSLAEGSGGHTHEAICRKSREVLPALSLSRCSRRGLAGSASNAACAAWLRRTRAVARALADRILRGRR